jgi:hypothetical protein
MGLSLFLCLTFCLLLFFRIAPSSLLLNCSIGLHIFKLVIICDSWILGFDDQAILGFSTCDDELVEF